MTGRNPSKTKASAGTPAGDHGGGSGHRHHGNARFARFLDEKEAGIRDTGRAGIRDERYRDAIHELPDDGCALGRFVVLEVARHGHVDAEVGQQRARTSSVLAGDEAYLLQDPEGAQGDVLEVADGGGDDVEGTGTN